MEALCARIATNPVGPLICMAVIVAIVLIVKSVLKVQRNPDGYVSVPDEGDADDAPAEDSADTSESPVDGSPDGSAE